MTTRFPYQVRWSQHPPAEAGRLASRLLRPAARILLLRLRAVKGRGALPLDGTRLRTL